MDARTELLQLDTPAPLRDLMVRRRGPVPGPLRQLLRPRENIAGQPITDALGAALVQTLPLVTARDGARHPIGITLGIITALRQYSTLDYGVTFTAFLFFSLPIFWVAVLLKEFGAIGFNNFLRNPEVPPSASLGIGVVAGAADSRAAGGPLKRRLLAGAVAFAVRHRGAHLFLPPPNGSRSRAWARCSSPSPVRDRLRRHPALRRA